MSPHRAPGSAGTGTGTGSVAHQVETPAPEVPIGELDLPALRAYRLQLVAEEDRVSYWRRLVHARIDMLEARTGGGAPLSVEDLARVLGDTGTGRSRQALVSVRAEEPLPALPDLERTWASEVDPGDPEAVAAALERLGVAETELGHYRHALHERLDEATRQLVARYRDDPTRALDVLPPP